MFNFTKDEKLKIAVYMAQALSEMEHSNDAHEVISNLYCFIMEDASEKSGKAVAKITEKVIACFNNAMCRSSNSTKFDFIQFFNSSMNELSKEKKSEVLHCFIKCLSDIHPETEDCRNNLQNTADNQDSLVTELYEKFRNICAETDTDIILEDIKTVDFASLDYVKAILGADMYAAIKGIIIYGLAKKHELSDIPSDVSVSQCVLGSYVETCLTDEMGNAYIMSENDESLKKEISKIILSLLPAAIFITCILSVFSKIEFDLTTELEPSVLNVLSLVAVSAPLFWYIGIHTHDIVFPMIDGASDKIKSMKIFTEETVHTENTEQNNEQPVQAKAEEETGLKNREHNYTKDKTKA